MSTCCEVTINAVVTRVEFLACKPADIIFFKTTIFNGLPWLESMNKFCGLFSPEMIGIIDGILIERLILLIVDISFLSKIRRDWVFVHLNSSLKINYLIVFKDQITFSLSIKIPTDDQTLLDVIVLKVCAKFYSSTHAPFVLILFQVFHHYLNQPML